MIVLTVQTYNGAPTEALSASFDELGGTIGRAETNQLVLPDPERSVSRLHARIVYRQGAYAIVDQGSNAVLLNGQAVGQGREAPLRDGDLVEICGYAIRVSYGQRTVASDPFADLFGTPAPAPRAPAAPPRAPATAPPPAFVRPPAPPPAARTAIPDDWDPFAPDNAPTEPAAMPGGPLVPDLPLQAPASQESLDSLFGLKGADPWSGSPLADPTRPNTAAAADPLRALSAPAAAAAAPMADRGSELNTPWIAPPLREPPAPAPPPGAVLSWQQTSREAKVVTPPEPRRAPEPAVAPDALARAFLEGLGMPELALAEIDVERAKLIGRLLHEAVGGAVQLLQARAALKSEVRAQGTVIGVRDNNPLKFSPSAEVAARYLFGPPVPGFMTPERAMRDAFDDLRAHQLGVMAGMRAALEGVLRRFDPAVLESKLTHRSPLGDLIPATRRAKLWQLFEDLYAQLSSEAVDEFDKLFGDAFRQAYEAQIERLRRDG